MTVFSHFPCICFVFLDIKNISVVVAKIEFDCSSWLRRLDIGTTHFTVGFGRHTTGRTTEAHEIISLVQRCRWCRI